MSGTIVMTATELTLRIILAVVIILVGLGIGLWLRRWLVRRLKNSVLDNWLVQVLGVMIVLPPLVIAGGVAAGIVTNGLDQLLAFLSYLSRISGISSRDVAVFTKNFIFSLVIVIFGIGVARTISRLMVRGIGEHRLDLNLRILILRVSYIIVFLVAIFWILAIWQVAIELPVTVLGTLTIAITFSVQDILKNLVAGLYILIEHPFFIGDQISTANYTGQVVAVELRATRVRLVSGEEVTIPNALVFGGIVINNSRYTERRATVVLALPLADFARDETPERIQACLKEQADVIEKPEPALAVSDMNSEKVELTLHFWIASGQLATVTEVVYALRTLLPGADVLVKETAGDV